MMYYKLTLGQWKPISITGKQMFDFYHSHKIVLLYEDDCVTIKGTGIYV